MRLHETVELERLITTLKKAAATLRDADVPFAVGGGLAAWARGGPEVDHDVDLFVPPRFAERAAAALADAGMRVERPPEEWLLKAHDGGATVDVIFAPSGVRVDEALLERADEVQVQAMTMPVAALEDVLVSKLLALNEQELQLAGPLEIARSLREQINWEEVWHRTEDSPFAAAFRTLVEKLGIVQRDMKDG
jgi:predicted nucleotidyltransferase